MKKSKTRIFVNKSISSNLIIYIKDKQHHFLRNVMRIKINDEINVEIQNKLDSIFNNYLLIVKEIHDYKIEDIESRLEKAVSETDILILNQIYL